MNTRSTPRPGGRSARVQAAVHRATKELIAEQGRAALAVPLIAARAGVTPSTIYRRWGDLTELLADVALERLRPDSSPLDTGTVQGDLQAWADQYRDEMGSELGRTMLRDVISARSPEELEIPCPCAEIVAGQIGAIVERARARGQDAPEVEWVMDKLVAPIVYRSLFGLAPISPTQVRSLVKVCLSGERRPGSGHSPSA